MKKILVAFDGSLYSESALNYAIQLSQDEPGNIITGVFIEDLNYAYMFSNFGVDPASYELPGTYGEYLEEVRQNEEASLDVSKNQFEKRCQEAGVNYTIHWDEGVTVLELIRESTFADILLIGYQTYFSNIRDSNQKVLKDFLAEAKCPVMVVPETYNTIDHIVFSYNGKEDSVYAIRHFTYLLKYNYQQAEQTLLHVKEKEDEVFPNEDLLKEYLDQHYPNIQYQTLIGKPEEKVADHTQNDPNTLLVLGSFGRNALSRLFASSVAKGFLKSKSNPVLIAHR